MKIALTGIALALSLALAGVAAPVDAQSGYRGGPPSGGTGGGYRGGPPQGGGFRGGPPPASGFRGAPPPATWRGTWRGPGWNSWHGGGRPWGPAWRPGWGWGGWGWNGWGWGTGWGPGWGWGVGWNPGWGWGPGVWGWGVGAPVIVAPSTVSVWSPPFEPTVYVEREGAAEVPAAPAAAPSTQQWWYWCASARGYYPYVGACPEGWQRVLPQVPAAPQ